MRKNKEKTLTKSSTVDVIVAIILVLYSIILITLLVWAVLTSLKTTEEYADSKIALPAGNILSWQWANYPAVLKGFVVGKYNMFGMFVNTLLYAGVNSLLQSFVPCIMAYAVVKYPTKLSKLIHATVLAIMMIPIVGDFPSMINVLNQLHLYDTRIGNWLMNFNFSGIYFLIFYGMIGSLSKELWEAAEIDGANQYKILFSIIIPQIINTIMLVVLIRFIDFWNEYQVALMYIPSYPTLSVGLFQRQLDNSGIYSSFTVQMASYVMFMVPILILFLIFRKKLMGNLSIGGVKE